MTWKKEVSERYVLDTYKLSCSNGDMIEVKVYATVQHICSPEGWVWQWFASFQGQTAIGDEATPEAAKAMAFRSLVVQIHRHLNMGSE